MRKAIIALFVILFMLTGVPGIWAWSDEVDGVLMPAPRGGGGISGEEAESEMYNAQEGSSSDPQALIEWE